MKKYKVRLNCNSFVNVVVQANNKIEAISEAYRVGRSRPQSGLDFEEFLEVEKYDEVEN